jgi:5'-3' exoribonuclease 2
MIEVPSWTWYYPFHASPLPSDLVNTLRNIKDINTAFTFNKDVPYKPLEQLMLILPKKTDLLNEKFIKIMDKFPQYYPETIKFDALWGQKFIYSEVLLPNIDPTVVLKEFNKIKLNSKELELNTLNELPLFFGHDE